MVVVDDLGVTRTGVISDELWRVIEPVLPPCRSGRRGRPWVPHREVLEAIAWRYRTGAPWRDLPADLGKWQTVWHRHRAWSGDGTYLAMFLAVQDHYGDQGQPDELAELLIAIDSTSVRAHQHAAGARRELPADSDLKKGRSELQEFGDQGAAA